MANNGITATTSEDIVVGAGEVLKDTNGNGIFGSLGSTQDDNVFRVTREYFVPALNGAMGPLTATDYITKELAELEATVPELSTANLPILVPGATSTTLVNTDTAAGIATTLAAATVAGQTLAIKVTAVTTMAIGQYFRFGGAGSKEWRKLTRVGTLGSGGSGIDIDFPLILPHANLDAVVQTDGDGSIVVSSGPQRRIPSTAYNGYALVVPYLDGRTARFIVYNAIMIDSPEWTAGDAKNMAPRLKLQARRTPVTAASRAAWDIVRTPAFG